MPIVEGTCGTRDLSRLLVAKRGLFQDESVLVEGLVPRRIVDGEKERESMKSSMFMPSLYHWPTQPIARQAFTNWKWVPCVCT